MPDALTIIKTRRSVREFEEKQIPPERLEEIIDAARFAATARNVQPWEFVVITDKARLCEIAALAPNGKFLSGAAACIAVLCKETNYYLEDGSAATCNILLAATALGIGSCWIAGDKKPYCQQINSLLNVPSGFKLISVVALGFPKDRHAFKMADKRSLAEILHWEKF